MKQQEVMKDVEILGVIVISCVVIVFVGKWLFQVLHGRGRCPFSDELPWGGHLVSHVAEPGWSYCAMDGVMTRQAGTDLATVGDVQNPHDCAGMCDAYENCNGYEYVGSRQECNLKYFGSTAAAVLSLTRQPQYTFGIKRVMWDTPEYDNVPFQLSPDGMYAGAMDRQGGIVQIADLAGRYHMAGWPDDHSFIFGADGRRVDDPTAKFFVIRDNFLTYVELPDTNVTLMYDRTSRTMRTTTDTILFSRVPD
jgi:hypothetical protein